jgi:hypothetical protein
MNTTSSTWIAIDDRLPSNGQRVLAFVPDHHIALAGTMDVELRPVIVLRFLHNFFADSPEKQAAHGVHFWAGEGVSNQYFSAVTHWQAVPEGPQLT